MLSQDRLHHLGCFKEEVGKYCLLPGDPDRVPLIASYLDKPEKVIQKREYNVYSGYLLDEKVSVVSTGIGGPSAAIALEELVMAGAHTFVRIGTAGGMQLDVPAGDLIIPTGAIRLDGTGKEYLPVEFPAVANYHVITSLIESAKSKAYPHHVGVVQCKDSFYGQHHPERMPLGENLKSRWNTWIMGGALASEMESATLFIVASVLKVRLGTVLIAVNNQEREKQNMPNKWNDDVTRAMEVGVDAICRLIEGDLKNADN